MSITVQNLLSGKTLKSVVSATPETSVFEALLIMRSEGVGTILILNDNGFLMGLFSHLDNSFRVTLESRDPFKTTLEEVMTPILDVHTVTIYADIDDCIDIMDREKINHIPVVEGAGETTRVIGVISNKDIERELSNRNHARENQAKTVQESGR